MTLPTVPDRRLRRHDLSRQVDLSVAIVIRSGADSSLLGAMRDKARGLTTLVGKVRGGSNRMRSAARESPLEPTTN
jgi:hypothetical protein